VVVAESMMTPRDDGRAREAAMATTTTRDDARRARTTMESLPMEIVQEILARRVRDDGARGTPTAATLRCVSRTFRDAIEREPTMFYEDFDISYGFCAATDARMRAYAKKSVFVGVRRLNLSGCGKLTDATLRLLGESCESLESVVFSGGSFTKAGMLAFAECRSGLTAVKIDLSSPKMTPADVLEVLEFFIARNHDTLRSVSCGREAPYSPHERRAFSTRAVRLFEAIRRCGELRSLDLTNCGEDVRFPLFSMQRALPHLQELRLNHFGGESGWRIVGDIGEDFENTCWKDLRVLEIAVSMETTSVGHRYGNSNVNDETMISMLYGSIETIETLDLTGCTHIGDWRNLVWDRLPTQLKTLRCARTPISSDDGSVAHIIAHLCPALEVLELADVGANARFVTDAAFQQLFAHDGPGFQLRVLRIPGSSVTASTIKHLVSGRHGRFPNLRTIDLASCRSLPRELRRISLDTFPRDNVRALRQALGVADDAAPGATAPTASTPDVIVIPDSQDACPDRASAPKRPRVARESDGSSR
jgi:F-box/leucine-rich repeat protein 6